VSHWTAYDNTTFLVDIGIYHPRFHEVLTRDEKEQELRYKPVISRQRFVVSRTILRHILLYILSEENIADIVLIRNEHGRILVKDHLSVYISLSYSGTCAAITVGKRKLGSDIELIRPLRDKKIVSSPIFNNSPGSHDKERTQRVVHTWTLVESYAKLYDKNPYPLLNATTLFTNANFVSYCINQQMIFSLASDQEKFTDALVWLDTSGIKKNPPV
jgi:phosphopantetheinyl transferase